VALPMFKKSFVSIYFLQDKIQILQLSSNKKGVKVYATVDLPKGLFADHKVVDVNSLAKILKSAWKKLGIREKSAGIIIPEFSTFIKLFELPNLNVQELDEALGWQAQEFLPTSSTEMIMDWKIVKKLDKSYQVLAVAVEKEILNGYVMACELAGLFPLVVETPSLSIARLAEDGDESKLVLYINKGESLLLFVQGKKILGSSVIVASDIGDAETTAKRMLSHFSKERVSNLLVGGVVSDKASVEKMATDLKLTLKLINSGVTGISEVDAQNYLIPISSQKQDPEPPDSPVSLNLLPGSLVEKYKVAKIKLQVWSLTLTTTFFIWFTFLVTLGSYLFVSQQIGELNVRNAQVKNITQQRQEAADRVANINSTADKVIAIADASVLPQKVMNLIYRAKPAGVNVTDYDIDLDMGEGLVKGFADSRQSLVDFKKNMDAYSEIGSVSIPISNFEEETNLEFRLTFNYLPISDSVKKKTK
jgi:hypothetical protein